MREDEAALRSLPYVPALDGVRGVAIAAVVVYHAEPSWLPGGMLGVTIFFTLSGFLITSLLVRELEATGRVHLRDFWMRRARRLAPASIATAGLVAVLVAFGWHSVTSGLVGDAASALTWTANWRFIANGTSYGSLFRDPSPFQQFWSLAIEEQVYVVLPIAAVLLLGRHAGHRLRFAAFLLAGVAVSTYLAATLNVTGDGGRVYFGTDTRLAEPFVGAVLALWLARGGAFVRLGRVSTRAAGSARCLALGGLAVLAARLSMADARLYDGGFLLAAVLTGIVIIAATQGTAIARILSARPLVRLGAISYGVYLFHWPVFEWFGSRFPGADHPTLVAAELGATLVLAIVSHALLEKPIRRRWRASPRVFVAGWSNASVAALAAIVVVAAIPASHAGVTGHVDLGIGVNDVVPPPPVTRAPRLHALAAAGGPAVVSHLRTGRAGAPTPITPQEKALLTGGDDWSNGRSEAPPDATASELRVAVVGDSLSHNLATGLRGWAKDRTDIVVYDLAISFCPLSRGGARRWEEGESFAVNPGCSWWDDPSSERSTDLATFSPDVVVDEAGFSEMLDRRQPDWATWLRPGDRQYHQWLLGEYDAMFGAMQSMARTNTRFLTLNVPCGDFSRPRGWERVSGADERVRALDQSVYPFLSRSSQGDLFGQLCPNGQYADDLWGIHGARPDGMHLTDAAATELARRWLGPLVLQVGELDHPGAVITGPIPTRR